MTECERQLFAFERQFTNPGEPGVEIKFTAEAPYWIAGEHGRIMLRRTMDEHGCEIFTVRIEGLR
jgi:hypothetical protein